MIKFIKELISETSDFSMTRFLSLVCVFAAVIICLIAIVKEQPLDGTVSVVTAFLAAGFGGKIVQKFAEVKETQNEEK